MFAPSALAVNKVMINDRRFDFFSSRDYGEDTSFYGNDDSTIPQASASSTIDQYDQYEEDNRYTITSK